MTPSTDSKNLALDDIRFDANRDDPQELRLLAALLDARRRLTAASLEDKVVEVCGTLLKRADEKARRAPYVAWDCLRQIDDELLAAMKDEGELKARWCSVHAEAEEKLKDTWRGNAGDCLSKLPDAVPLRARLRELQTLVATAAQNQHHKIELFEKGVLPSLTWLLGLTVTITFALALGFLYFAYATERLSDEPIAPLLPWAQAIVLGIPAGALGGILSMAFSLGRADMKLKIPDVRLSRLMALTRPLLGATVAIPILVFVEAGYVTVAFNGPLAIFAFCFVGGFSERWFLGVMERFVAGKK